MPNTDGSLGVTGLPLENGGALHQLVNNTENRADRIHHLVSSNTKQGARGRNETSLSVIKATDGSDHGELGNFWASQGARPKKTCYDFDDDNCIVSGVDPAFLARHSNDSSLTRSVCSRTGVPANHMPYLTLPVLSNHERGSVDVPSEWRTSPILEERQLPHQMQHDSFLNNASSQPYQGLPHETDAGEEHFDTRKSKKAKGKDSLQHIQFFQRREITDADTCADDNDDGEAVGDGQMKEQSQVVFDNIHPTRYPSMFGSSSVFNREHHWNGNIDLYPTQDTNTNSLTDESYDSSMESYVTAPEASDNEDDDVVYDIDLPDCIPLALT